jgi:hypothetical protein
MKKILAVSLGLVSSKMSFDFSPATILEADDDSDSACIPPGSYQCSGPPPLGWTVREGTCIKLRDNYNIFDLKQIERGANSTFSSIGSKIDCIEGHDGQDDCAGEGTDSIFLYKVCQPEFGFPLKIFSLDYEGSPTTEETEKIGLTRD